jgi:hypothetical protein
VILATISATTFITVVSAMFTAAAAIATFAAVVYAKRTVTEARVARTESHAAHGAAMAAMEARSAAGTDAGWLLGEMRAATEAAAEQHRLRMAERELSFTSERADRQLLQMQRVAQVLFDLIDAAREETLHESELFDFGNGRMIGATAIPALQNLLDIEVHILQELGGLDVSGIMPTLERDDDRAGVQRLWTGGLTSLQKFKGKSRLGKRDQRVVS